MRVGDINYQRGFVIVSTINKKYARGNLSVPKSHFFLHCTSIYLFESITVEIHPR